jgi:hypothetical protein
MQRRIILVIAPSGSGKTRLVSEMIADIDRVAVFDTVKRPTVFHRKGQRNRYQRPTPARVCGSYRRIRARRGQGPR